MLIRALKTQDLINRCVLQAAEEGPGVVLAGYPENFIKVVEVVLVGGLSLDWSRPS